MKITYQNQLLQSVSDFMSTEFEINFENFMEWFGAGLPTKYQKVVQEALYSL